MPSLYARYHLIGYFWFTFICGLISFFLLFFCETAWLAITFFFLYFIFLLIASVLKEYVHKVGDYIASLILSGTMIWGCYTLIIRHPEQKWANLFLLVILMAYIFTALFYISLLIERTKWYQNLERGRLLLLQEEEDGAEPDPKDFE